MTFEIDIIPIAPPSQRRVSSNPVLEPYCLVVTCCIARDIEAGAATATATATAYASPKKLKHMIVCKYKYGSLVIKIKLRTITNKAVIK